MRMFARIGVSLALCVSPAIVHAQPADRSAEAFAQHLAEVGTWDFAARKNGPDGKPECTEIWHFDTDGSGWVQSGAQRVTLTWRTTLGNKTDRWLYTASQSTTSGPDCMGNAINPADYPHEETGFTVLFFNSGTALTCEPAKAITQSDGTTAHYQSDASCWGIIKPAATN